MRAPNEQIPVLPKDDNQINNDVDNWQTDPKSHFEFWRMGLTFPHTQRIVTFSEIMIMTAFGRRGVWI
jgi:hypothetical protein